jgi:hypothetical protein
MELAKERGLFGDLGNVFVPLSLFSYIIVYKGASQIKSINLIKIGGRMNEKVFCVGFCVRNGFVFCNL